MGKNSSISWTHDTWNPWVGCKKVSLGCVNCYMFRERERFGEKGTDIRRTKDATFLAPLKYAPGRLVFVCSFSDFFLPEADEWRAEAWNVIRSANQCTFQILTKRPDRIKECLPEDWGDGWSNVWLGVSVEDQRSADKRLPLLAGIPAVLRFVSAEPLLDAVNVSAWLRDGFVDWVIVGGESGPKSRHMHLEWVLDLWDDCDDYCVPFFFKQWGGTTKVDGDWGGNKISGRLVQEMPTLNGEKRHGKVREGTE